MVKRVDEIAEENYSNRMQNVKEDLENYFFKIRAPKFMQPKRKIDQPEPETRYFSMEIPDAYIAASEKFRDGVGSIVNAPKNLVNKVKEMDIPGKISYAGKECADYLKFPVVTGIFCGIGPTTTSTMLALAENDYTLSTGQNMIIAGGVAAASTILYSLSKNDKASIALTKTAIAASTATTLAMVGTQVALNYI